LASATAVALGPTRDKRAAKPKESASGGGDWVVPALVGLGLGYGLAEVVRRARQRSRRSDSGQTGQLSQEALADVKGDPELAQIIAAPPAVPLDTVPEEVTPEAEQAIQSAATPQEAVAAAKRFVRNEELAEVIATLVAWRTRPNNLESQYQTSFRRWASKHGYAGQIEEKRHIPWGGGGGSRTAVPDMILRKRVLVELKADLTGSAEADRAMGQMLRYLLAFKDKGPAVLAVCGEVSREIRFLVRMYITTWRKSVNLPVTVFFKRGSVDVRDEDAEMPTEGDRREWGT
jgi:hypothetical protein